MELQIDSLARSLVLFYLLAAARAFWFAVPLRKGDAPSNVVVREGRSLFRGAPLLLFFAVGFAVAGAAPIHDARSSIGRHEVHVERDTWQGQPHVCARGCTDDRGPLEEVDGGPFYGVESPRGLWPDVTRAPAIGIGEISVLVLEYQRRDVWERHAIAAY